MEFHLAAPSIKVSDKPGWFRMVYLIFVLIGLFDIIALGKPSSQNDPSFFITAGVLIGITILGIIESVYVRVAAKEARIDIQNEQILMRFQTGEQMTLSKSSILRVKRRRNAIVLIMKQKNINFFSRNEELSQIFNDLQVKNYPVKKPH